MSLEYEIINRDYERPKWKEVKKHVDSLGNVAEKLNYLRETLRVDEERAYLASWEYLGGDEQDSGWVDRGLRYDIEVPTEEEKEAYRLETKDWRKRVRDLIHLLEKQLPPDYPTQEEIERRISEEAQKQVASSATFRWKDSRPVLRYLLQSVYSNFVDKQEATKKEFFMRLTSLFRKKEGGVFTAKDVENMLKKATAQPSSKEGVRKVDEAVEEAKDKRHDDAP